MSRYISDNGYCANRNYFGNGFGNDVGIVIGNVSINLGYVYNLFLFLAIGYLHFCCFRYIITADFVENRQKIC